MNEAIGWLAFNLMWILILAFYSMEEMACVSMNKIRLQYYVSQDSKSAKWLNYLLHNPSRLFGTTLIGVNVATFASSECARRFHEALGVNPDWTPLSQVFLILLFGELAPIFAARRYAENMAMLGAPLLYISSQVLAPAIWVLGAISKLFNHLIGGKERNPNLFLTEDELQKVLEEQDEDKIMSGEKTELNVLAANLLKLRQKEAHNMMTPLDSAFVADSNILVSELRNILKPDISEIPIYLRQKTNIIGMVTVRDLIKAHGEEPIRKFARSPWFVTEKSKLVQILKQFRKNNENMGIVLNNRGQACGILSMDDVITAIFGKSSVQKYERDDKKIVIIDRTLPGDMSLKEFNEEFETHLEGEEEETLSTYIIRHVGHHPEEGEVIYISPFEITVKKATLLSISSVRIRTRSS